MAYLGGPAGIWPALLVAYCVLLPRELLIDISGAVLFPYRLALLALFPLAIARLLRFPTKPQFTDFVVGFVAIWIFLSLLVNDPLERAMVFGGATSADFLCAYVIGRAILRTSDQFRAFFVLMIPALGLIALLLAAESISHRLILRPFIASLMGLPPVVGDPSLRLGLMRAYGPFQHPILAGVFMASLLPIAWYTIKKQTFRVIGMGISTAAFFTVSSAAIMALLLNIFVVGLNECQKIFRLPLVPIAIAYAVAIMVFVSVASNDGLISFLVRRATLDPSTGYYRMLIWQYAGAEAVANPIFGIGLRDWTRPVWMTSETIDAYWLVQTMRYGFPAGVGTFLVFASSMFIVLRGNKNSSASDRDISNGIAICLFGIVFAAITVHLWEGIAAWALLVAGAAVSIGQQRELYSEYVGAARRPKKG